MRITSPSRGRAAVMLALLVAPAVLAPGVGADYSAVVLTRFQTERTLTSAVWAGVDAYVFGGIGCGGACDEVYRYDVAALAVRDTGARLPTPRGETSAVWDGTRAFVLGGRDGATLTPEIVRYVPASNAVTVTGATLPTARSGTSAVWDGTHAYVFGGTDAGGRLDEIVRYDPATGTVTTMTATLPTPREFTSAVWDGTHAYVFGGRDGTGHLDEIVRYDPATDAVTVMQATLPTARSETAAVWDGYHALVVGGRSASGLVDRVVRYNATTDVAVNMSVSLQQGGRAGASAANDGERTFIFAGEEGTGASYRVLMYSTKPREPREFAAAQGTSPGQIVLTWQTPAPNTHSAPLQHYDVFRGTASGSLQFLVRLAPTTGYVDSGLPAGTRYYYAVQAIDGFGVAGVMSVERSARTAATPGGPQNVTATRGPDQGTITIEWDAPDDDGGLAIHHYHVYAGRSTSDITRIATLDGTARDFAHTGLPDGARRYYRVTAENDVGESAPSPIVSATAPDVPTGPRQLAARSGPGVGEVTLTWSPPADDGGFPLTAYRVYRGASAGAEAFLVELAADASTFTDTGLAEGARPWYRVHAVNVLGEGRPSASVQGRAPERPTSPQQVVATPGTREGSVSVTWKTPEDEGGLPVLQYVVYRKIEPDGTFEEAGRAGAGERSFVDEPLPAGTLASYGVSAVNLVGEGPRGDAPVPATPGPAGAPDATAPPSRHVVINVSPTMTALTPGSSVDVAFVGADGRPLTPTRADVRVGAFFVARAYEWNPLDPDFDAAAWSAEATAADLSATNGKLTFTYPGVSGAGGAPAVVWAEVTDLDTGETVGGYYATGKTTLVHYRVPLAPYSGFVVTPVFVR